MQNLKLMFSVNILQVVGGNKGGVVAVVEGLRGFIPFSQISLVGDLLFFPVFLFYVNS